MPKNPTRSTSLCTAFFALVKGSLEGQETGEVTQYHSKMEAGDGPSSGSVAQPLALRTPGLHPRGRIIVLCVCAYVCTVCVGLWACICVYIHVCVVCMHMHGQELHVCCLEM